MNPSNFSLHDWEQRTDPAIYVLPELNRADLPDPPDRYQPGHLTMGKDVDRGLAIQRARGRKQRLRNQEFFLSTVIPMVADRLNPAAWRDLAHALDRPEFFIRGGFVRYALGDRASWVHPGEEPDKVKQAEAMGATIQP